MQTLLLPMLGISVCFEQVGEGCCTGQLASVQEDYASILTREHRIIHYPYRYVQSFRTDVTDWPQVVTLPNGMVFPPTFYELVESLIQSPVYVMHGGKQSQGILSSIEQENARIIVSPKEVLYYPVCQIRNIAPVYKLEIVEVNKSNCSSVDEVSVMAIESMSNESNDTVKPVSKQSDVSDTIVERSADEFVQSTSTDAPTVTKRVMNGKETMPIVQDNVTIFDRALAKCLFERLDFESKKKKRRARRARNNRRREPCNRSSGGANYELSASGDLFAPLKPGRRR